ncbi:hypothetical protein KAU45_08545 [bacterium]|nr:hypothetical protein [bacterium]
MALGVEIGLRNLVEDLTPKLGGNLDVSGFSIVSIADGNIVIAPDGSGHLALDHGPVGVQVSGTYHERINVGGNLGFDLGGFGGIEGGAGGGQIVSGAGASVGQVVGKGSYDKNNGGKGNGDNPLHGNLLNPPRQSLGLLIVIGNDDSGGLQ